MNSIDYYKERIRKMASEQNEDDFDENGKIPAIEKAFSNPLDKKVAYMIATSHEYKKPNVKAALTFVKNYKWELSNCRLCNMQGINKPVNKEKVADMVKNMKRVDPFIVVNQFHGIRPQTPGKKILIDGHHRMHACEAKGMDEIPVYKGTYTGNAERPIEELREKTAAEEQFYYHASPVQGIKKFRHSEDTSGNNKGKVVFASKEPSFSAAFGIRWNDGTARLSVQTKNKKVPTKENYVGTVLRYTDKVNIDAPCSMYKLKGNFKPLRYSDDIESYTNDDVEIISEEQFNSFKEMAKAYDLDLRPVTDNYVINNLKSKKSSNFEKKAMEKIAKKKSQFQKLRDNEVPLTPEERAIVKARKAEWSGGDSAVWKSVHPETGEVTYVTHTHRAYNTAPTLKGAVGRFHSFIKSTASEEIDNDMKKEASTSKSYIIAVDFDGTIKTASDMNEYGKLNPNCKEVLEFLKTIGCKLILWTCRNGEQLEAAKAYLKQNGLLELFDKINENVEGMFETSNKIFANYYVDDRNIGGFPGWLGVKKIVLLDLIKQHAHSGMLGQLQHAAEHEKHSRRANKLIDYANKKLSGNEKTAKEITSEEAQQTLNALNVDPAKKGFDVKTFTDGMNVELEHGKEDSQTNVTNDDPLLTAKIALRHLKESPKYYALLKEMEKKFKKKDGDQ